MPRALPVGIYRGAFQFNIHLKQVPIKSNGYDHLEGEWLTYYKVASRFAHRAQAQDREDLLHDIIITLADVERNNGHKPFTEAVMYRIASRTVAYYWRSHYAITNGLDCAVRLAPCKRMILATLGKTEIRSYRGDVEAITKRIVLPCFTLTDGWHPTRS